MRTNVDAMAGRYVVLREYAIGRERIILGTVLAGSPQAAVRAALEKFPTHGASATLTVPIADVTPQVAYRAGRLDEDREDRTGVTG